MLDIRLKIEDNGSFAVSVAHKITLLTVKSEGTVTLEGNTNDIIDFTINKSPEEQIKEVIKTCFGLTQETIDNIDKSCFQDNLKKVADSIK